MNDKIVCPLSLAGPEVKACHPNCKLNDDNKCLLAEYLKKQTKN